MQTKFSLIILSLMLCLAHGTMGQIGLGWSSSLDLYQHQKAPVPADSLEGTQGSLLINPGFGPKIFIGGKNFSISGQAGVSIALFDLNINEYKGMGSFYFPIMASLNFMNLSGFQGEAKYGFSVSVGVQQHFSELFFKPSKYQDVETQDFRTIFGQIQFGIGEFGRAAYVYLRYGQNKEGNSNWNIGLATEVNWIAKRKYKKLGYK